jgi:hypothetical protein
MRNDLKINMIALKKAFLDMLENCDAEQDFAKDYPFHKDFREIQSDVSDWVDNTIAREELKDELIRFEGACVNLLDKCGPESEFGPKYPFNKEFISVVEDVAEWVQDELGDDYNEVC